MLKRSLPLLAFLFALQAMDASAQSAADALKRYGNTRKTSAWTSARADNAVEEAVASGQKARVILRYKPGARTRLATWLTAANQGKTRGEARTLNAMTLELPANLVKQLSDHADTLGISIDAKVCTTQVMEPAVYANAMAGAAASYDGQRLRATLGVKPTDVGRGVGVAIVDSGIAPTLDLAGRISAFYDFTGDGAPRPQCRPTRTVTAPTSPA